MYSEVLNGNSRRYNYKEFVCDTLEDLYAINVSKIAAGSKALIIEGNKKYILSNSKEWKVYTDYTQGGNTYSMKVEDDDNGNVRIIRIIE